MQNQVNLDDFLAIIGAQQYEIIQLRKQNMALQQVLETLRTMNEAKEDGTEDGEREGNDPATV